MAHEADTLGALQAFHAELLAIRERRADSSVLAENDLVATFEVELGKVLDRPAKNAASREAVKNNKVQIDGVGYDFKPQFQQQVLYLSDDADLDEIEASRILLEAQEDQAALGRPLLECAIIRYHRQRSYVLDCVRLLLELSEMEEEDLGDVHEAVSHYVGERIFGIPSKIVARCMSQMEHIKQWLQRVAERITAASVIEMKSKSTSREMQTIEFSRVSLVQQHELLGVILCRSVEKRQATVADFQMFLQVLKKADKYDHLLVHLFPALGAYIAVYGSTEGSNDVTQARQLNEAICVGSETNSWPLPYLQAAVRAWWLAEYSGFYLDDTPSAAIPGLDLDEEDRQRTKQFMEALKDGAFDFMLSIAADVRSPEWQDPSRIGIRQWLQRKSPALASDGIQFSDFFQLCLMVQLEVFVDAFISNLPDVLRKLRVEEDEQRQLSQAHEQDLDLERFLIIIAYSYEGRQDVAMNFWSDPDSNLAGFMHWASRRASTPLVSAFCEMLQAISVNEDCATAAHEFLLDEGHHSSGKMRRSQSLTWSQIFKELVFFSNKIREKPAPPPTLMYRAGKPSSDQAESEPESAMMLECYLRLITKLSAESETARQYLLQDSGSNLVDILYQLAGSQIPPRLRACTFSALTALLSRKTQDEGNSMWQILDSWVSGNFAPPTAVHLRPATQTSTTIDRTFEQISTGYEEPNAFIKLLIALITPAEGASELNDSLPFPESLGSNSRMPGIDMYVDFVLGTVFALKANDIPEPNQLRTLRLTCLEFALIALTTFNEDLIILGNEANVQLDAAIGASDLATYVRMHPFARVMEWMFNDKVMAALFSSVHQDTAEIGNVAPDSPIILGVLRGVEVISKVLDLQATYLDLVRPMVKLQPKSRHTSVANAAYASFEDGLVSHLNLVVDLGIYCGIGHPDLTLASLKLLERISMSPKIISGWSASERHAHRNKAIVAMEANGDHESIARHFGTELRATIDVGKEADSPAYLTKMYILDFIYSTLKASPNQPTIAHLLLGFKCGVDSLSVDANSAFATGQSVFHGILAQLLEVPFGFADDVRLWLVALKVKSMRIIQILWTSPLSAPIILDELRGNDVLFHFLMRQVLIQPSIPWEGESIAAPHFPLTDGAPTLVDFLAWRSMSLEYIAMELCSVAQARLPSLKRRIFDALNGQIVVDDSEPIAVPTIFDLYDFLLPESLWEVPQPQVAFYRGLGDLKFCQEADEEGSMIYNLDRVKQVLLLKRNESRLSGTVTTAVDLANIEREETSIMDYLLVDNRRTQVNAQSLKVLRRWTSLMLVMIESSDFEGTTKISFLLQALQAILPSLEAFASERPAEAIELARLARILLFKLDAKDNSPLDRDQAVGNLISEKLFQLFQICLQAIGRWAGGAELRTVYYGICYRYLSGMVDTDFLMAGRQKTIKTIQVYGERLINVICDDALGSDSTCQTAALILLTALVHTGRQENESHVVDMLNRLNFIGILVDSLRNVMVEWAEIVQTGNADNLNYYNAKLALILQLCQTREGAKYVLHANLFRAIEISGLFAADPELQVDPANPQALEKHYALLAKVTRIIASAIVSRGSSNVLQGRRFLTEHRMLVSHTLKRSAGIGPVESGLEEQVEDLAEAFMVMLSATDFLEFENEVFDAQPKQGPQMLFH